MGKLMMLWGRVEKNKKFAWKNKKICLGVAFRVPCPGRGRGYSCPLSPALSPFVKVTNVTHIHETHRSHIEAPQKPIRRHKNLYPYRKIYANSPYIIMKYLNTINFKGKVNINRVVYYIYKYILYTPLYIYKRKCNKQPTRHDIG